MAPPDSTGQQKSKHRSTLSLQKTEIKIHVYDLLPPGRVSSILWTVGASLLHSGVVIHGKEYAYGGHDKRGVTGVYWTKPKTEPPGGAFRCELLHGFTLAAQEEIDAALRDASEEFLGTSYNLLTKNCNHFTSYLCQKLTSNPGPGWLNRAASIGVALPCVVPREWVEAPEYETANGELLDDDDDDDDDDDNDDNDDNAADESSRMLFRSKPHFLSEGRNHDEEAWDSEEEGRKGRGGKGKGVLRDASGRRVPPAERARR